MRKSICETFTLTCDTTKWEKELNVKYTNLGNSADWKKKRIVKLTFINDSTICDAWPLLLVEKSVKDASDSMLWERQGPFVLASSRIKTSSEELVS